MGQGRIRDEDIALVREHSPIEEVVGEHLQLRNAGGGSMKGLCPFHDEKSPSFHVTPSRGFFYCFGCSAGGDVISFVQQVDHLSFVEAVERLAARAGVELRYQGGGFVPGQEQGQRIRLIEAHRAATEFYTEQLMGPDAEPGRRFLAERGFERADAEHFGVGYAPASWEALVRHLRGRGFTDRELTTAGLASEGRRGPIDRFRGRLVWPIRDLSGDVVGFGARRLREDDNAPKYLNTPETPIFKKGSVLYGIDLAKREIGRRRQAVIVEGYTDVMACHLAGVPTAIATCGTSFGEEHIKVLRRLLMDNRELQGEVIFTFDGDSAGQQAALRAFAEEQRFVTQTYVAVQADGLDPCDLRTQRGDAAVRELVAGRVPLYEFAIRDVLERYDLDSTEGRLAALDAAAPVVAQIKDRGKREQYARDLDRWLGFMDESFVRRRVVEHAGDGRSRQAAQRPSGERSSEERANARGGAGAQGDPNDPVVQVAREALKLAIQRPALAGPMFDALERDVFRAPVHAGVYDAVRAAGGAAAGSGGAEWVTRVREEAADDTVRTLVTELAVEPPHSDGDADERYATAILARLEELWASRGIAELKSRLQRLNPVEQEQEYNKLFGELVALEQQRRVLRERAAGTV